MTKKKKTVSEKNFEGRLRKVRIDLGFSQKDFAVEMEISNGTLSEIESGKYKPKYEFYQKISTRFNVNLYYLLFGEGEMYREEGVRLEGFSHLDGVEAEDMQRFLYVFERSKVMQYYILGKFMEFIHSHGATIFKEVEKSEKKPGE